MICSGVFEGAEVEFPTFPLTCVDASLEHSGTTKPACDGQAALPCWLPIVQMYKRLWTIYAPCEGFFILFYIIFRVPWYDLHNK